MIPMRRSSNKKENRMSLKFGRKEETKTMMKLKLIGKFGKNRIEQIRLNVAKIAANPISADFD